MPGRARSGGAGSAPCVRPRASSRRWRCRSSGSTADTALARAAGPSGAGGRDRSWQPPNAEIAQAPRRRGGRESLLGLEVGHEDARAAVIEAEIVHVEDAHAEADLRADRIQRGI